LASAHDTREPRSPTSGLEDMLMNLIMRRMALATMVVAVSRAIG
jgi:hypothetical protein